MAVAVDSPVGRPRARDDGYWRQSLRRLRSDPSAIVGAALVLAVLAFALVGSLVYGHDPNFQRPDGLTVNGDPRGFSADYPLGTDSNGRDVLARLIAGANVSLLAAALAISLSALIGIVIGGTAGIARPLVRELLMRAVDVVLSFPVLLLAMVFLAVQRPSLVSVGLIIGVGWGAYLSRIVFGIVNALSGRDLMASAVAIGASRTRILVRHLLPHALPAVIVYVTLGVGVAIQTEAVFGYIGVGIQPPRASWGNMIADGQAYIVTQPRLVFVPAAAIIVAMLGFTLLGDGLRHALDTSSSERGASREALRA